MATRNLFMSSDDSLRRWQSHCDCFAATSLATNERAISSSLLPATLVTCACRLTNLPQPRDREASKEVGGLLFTECVYFPFPSS